MSLRVQLNRRFADFALSAAFEAPQRGITALFGPSGSGKTTILRAIAGLDAESKGEVWIGERLWQGPDRFLPAHRRGTGYVFQESSLFPHLDVAGNLAYGRKRRGTERQPHKEAFIELLGLEPLLHRRTQTLSGGERRRVAMARALFAAPELLLLDEPFTGLNESIRQDIYAILEALRDALDIPIILVSHDLAEVSRLADTLVILDQGSVVACGPLAETLTRLDLPLSHALEASAVLYGEVIGVDADWGLAEVSVGENVLLLPAAAPLRPGGKLRLRVAARDVSLIGSRAADSSILNILPARLIDLDLESRPLVTVRLELGDGQVLLSRITARSVKELSLQVGTPVFVQIKSAAVLP